MARMRGVFPIFLATALGVANGVWVFAPAFQEQQQDKEEQVKKPLEKANPSESDQIEKEALRNAEAAASRSAAREYALNPSSSTSWWSNMSLWSKGSQGTSENSGGKAANPNTKD